MLVIVNYLTKIVHFKPINIMTNALNLIKVIINIVIYHNDIFKSIVTD